MTWMSVACVSLLANCGRYAFDARPDGGMPDSSSAVVISFEAESGQLSPQFTTGADLGASGGAYVVDDNNSGETGPGSARYAFEIVRPADYYLWGRTRAPDMATDSFFVAFDGAADLDYHASDCANSATWLWRILRDAVSNCPALGTPRPVALAAGPHALVLSSREGQTAIDKIVITDDPAFVPAD